MSENVNGKKGNAPETHGTRNGTHRDVGKVDMCVLNPAPRNPGWKWGRGGCFTCVQSSKGNECYIFSSRTFRGRKISGTTGTMETNVTHKNFTDYDLLATVTLQSPFNRAKTRPSSRLGSQLGDENPHVKPQTREDPNIFYSKLETSVLISPTFQLCWVVVSHEITWKVKDGEENSKVRGTLSYE
ncbi:hypothetical protein YC2023_060520 [Brassica napus]